MRRRASLYLGALLEHHRGQPRPCGGECTIMANEAGGGNESRIGKGTRVNGKLAFGSKARIDGEVEGEITGEEIILSESAVVNARITADSLTIAGTVNGDLTARQRIELLATAR